ncbi:alkaline phosphatase family protein [Halomicrobium salinisoli]|uniref:alkaline phosphatase family protein n=1 Tax=Halomicrobium salinisoli TaxID=2878391 RepID=UPI001CF028C9|nr:alkaline phosphatase family protein [Halomicrobium salinisoli]
MTETIVLGLDGATWELLDPLIQEGQLPNLESVLEGGYRGTLESTFPPITAPAWLSMATGQNPGKTGVFYFLNRTDPESFDFDTMGADDFKGQSFWDVLDAAGLSTGVFNFPMLYPTYDVDGFMVSGFGAPEDATITSPASLQNELDEVTDGYELKVPYADPKYANRPDALEQDLHRIVEKREAAIEYLLREKDPDVFFGVVSATDWAQHYFWRYHDADHVLYESSEYSDALANLFARVDETVGKVASIAEDEDATLLIVSDHGFGPVNGTLYSNEWMEDAGFKTPKTLSPIGKLRTRYFPYLRNAIEPIVSVVPVLSDLASRIGRSVRGSPLDEIDQDRSVAFASEQGFTTGLIYMLSDDPSDRARVVEELRHLCEDQGLTVDIYSPEDLYSGPNVDLAPDILFEVEGLEYAVDPRPSTHDSVFVTEPPSPPRSGGHRHEGIYLLSGPGVASGDGDTRSLLDIAPTLLALQSLPVPEVMDGSPISEAFERQFEVETAPLASLVGRREDSGETQDSDEVRERLEDLGYI